MWSRFNAVGMRQRWGTLESDPGRGVHSERRTDGKEAGTCSGSAAERIRRAFFARDVIIDCSRPDCQGIYLTAARELLASLGSGSRVVLRCTRDEEEHSVTIQMKPYEEAEVELLSSALIRGESLRCPRCSTALRGGQLNDGTGPAIGSGGDDVSLCPWCGVRWIPRGQLHNQLGR